MNILRGPRGIIAVDQSKDALEKIRKSWPANGEVLRIGEWTDPKADRKHSSRRARRAEDAPA